ncbi:MAG: ferredoxin [Actinobacteria bacterium]|nr:ferredoxin [Actinomycetota bacterium]
MARVTVDPDLCVGHGRCYALAPEVFDADDDGHCVIRHEVVDGELEVKARVGADNCPELAITVED